MANLRFVRILAIDSTTIDANFTDTLSPLINTSNVVVEAITPGVPDATVLEVRVTGDRLRIITRPMTPQGAYFVIFQSTDSSPFKSLNGQATLFEDGSTNKFLIIGREDPVNPVRQFLLDYQKDNVFNLEPGTIVKDLINLQASSLSKALYDIRQLKNENYLQNIIFDENKTRGAGPFDRLNE